MRLMWSRCTVVECRYLIQIMLISLMLSTCKASDLDLCPINCTCDTSNVLSPSLRIDCQLSAMIDSAVQRNDINVMLVKFNKLTELTICNTAIIEVPSEVCKREGLRILHMDNNNLRELPDNCFSKLSKLETFTADVNQLVYLQDGLFDGLTNLQHISLKNNKISNIGLRVFSNYSDLRNLISIELRYNLLTTLEPWPFIRGEAANIGPNLRMWVDVSRNSITKFTNVIGWRTRGCNSSNVHSEVCSIDMSSNKIDRYSTLLDALQFESSISYVCWLQRNHLKLAGNTFFCDCFDFKVFAISYRLQHTRYLEGVYCSNTNMAQYLKASSISLDMLVCDVTVMCPTNCMCRNQPSNSTFHVHCSNRGLMTIPNEIPPLNFPRSFFMSPVKERYKLDLSGNNISELISRPFLQDVIYLNIGNSHLKNITEDAWRDIEHAETIYLNDNLLTTIPFVSNLSNYSFTTLSLYNNPLSCTCDQLWLKTMLLTVYGRLENPNSMKCNLPSRLSGHIIFDVDDDSFCNDPSERKAITIITTSMVLAFTLASLLVLWVIISPTVRYKCFQKFGIHPFDLDECDDETMKYDIFISFAHEDSALAREILAFLESHSYKVCFHQRDFVAGNPIIDNILDAVYKSKRVLCLITYNFLASNWCMEEFHAALAYNVKIKRHRLIALMSGQFKFPEKDQMDFLKEYELGAREGISSQSTSAQFDKRFLSLKNFTSSHTYIDSTSSDWRTRLLYTMPLKPLENCNTYGVACTIQVLAVRPMTGDHQVSNNISRGSSMIMHGTDVDRNLSVCNIVTEGSQVITEECQVYTNTEEDFLLER